MRTKVILALLVVAIMAVGITASTFALFTAGRSGQGNVAAGTLTLSSYRDQQDTVPGPMFYTTPAQGATPGGQPGLHPTGFWAPGDTFMRVLMVKNTGSLAAWLTGVQATLHAGSSSALAAKLQVKVTTDLAGHNVLAQGTLSSFVAANQHFSTRQALAVGPAPRALYFFVTLPLNADNSYQNQQMQADFTVFAEQQAHNP